MIIPPTEQIVERKICPLSGEEFCITDGEMALLDAVSPVFNGKKYPLPPHSISPIEMRKTILSYRNQNKLYKRTCSLTGNTIISMFSEDVEFPVYEKSFWYTDKWNPLSYGRTIDFAQEFFPQWNKLNEIVPRSCNSRHGDENSDFSNNCGYIKDCYLCFNGLYNERCYYCQVWDYSKSCIDCEGIFECENCYGLNLSKKCNACWYAYELTNCSDCILCYDCIGCTNCFGCSNLRNKSNYLFNSPSSPETIRKYLAENLPILSYDTLKKIIAQAIHKYAYTVQSENCIGDEFQSSKNCFESYYMIGSEDCRYCDYGKEETNCQFVVNGMKNLSHAYGSVTVGINASNVLFSINSTDNLSDVIYCSQVYFGTNHCFGSIGLHNHEHHCILNKAYSVAEYETLCGKLIDHMQSTGEWGEFFPRKYCPFEYNESLAQDIIPLTPEEVRKGGWRWRDEDTTVFEGTAITPLPIQEYDEKIVGYEVSMRNIDALLNGIIVCEVSKKPFKIIRQELAFYIENGLPIPTKHPTQRHIERITLRNPRKLYERTCTECAKEIITTYAPGENSERVVCEECYRRLVY